MALIPTSVQIWIKKERPSMEQAVERLKEALEISTRAKAGAPQTKPEQSFTAS